MIALGKFEDKYAAAHVCDGAQEVLRRGQPRMRLNFTDANVCAEPRWQMLRAQGAAIAEEVLLKNAARFKPQSSHIFFVFMSVAPACFLPQPAHRRHTRSAGMP